MKKPPHATMTTADFDRLLAETIDNTYDDASGLLEVPGVYELASEHFNNEVLEAYDSEQNAEAMPDEEE